MILAVASGKGGTGKTSISVNLAKVLGVPVQLLDCDVEEPNAHLFLRGTLIGEEEIVIKSLTDHFKKMKCISGASVLGDGSIALILDPFSVIAEAK